MESQWDDNNGEEVDNNYQDFNLSSRSSFTDADPRFAVSPNITQPMRAPAPTPTEITLPTANFFTFPNRRSTLARSRSMSHISSNHLVYLPVSQGAELKCKIIRKKEGQERFFPHYELFIENDDNTLNFLLSARKIVKSKTSFYQISLKRLENLILNEKNLKTGDSGDEDIVDNEIVAKVRSNFVGTQFVVYDNGFNPLRFKDSTIPKDKLRKELTTIIYEQNILGYNGPRKMTILLPAMDDNNERYDTRPTNVLHSETMIERIKNKDRHILVLHNKSPQWSEDNQSFVLNFQGRVTMASVKNFQIIHDNDLDYIVMQFGRVTKESFTMDFKYPLCPVQAFGIALS
ncbi:hypothetical protein HK099_006770, partial [Clydaea vesicula]